MNDADVPRVRDYLAHIDMCCGQGQHQRLRGIQQGECAISLVPEGAAFVFGVDQKGNAANFGGGANRTASSGQ